MDYEGIQFEMFDIYRPGAGEDPAKVTLTAQISKNQETDTIDTPIIILPLSKAEALNNDLTFLSQDKLLKDNKDVSAITKNLKLYITGPNGSTITWTSSNESFANIKEGSEATEKVKVGNKEVTVDTKECVIKRPTFTQGNVSVTLTATLTLLGETLTKDFIFVLQKAPISPQETLDQYVSSLEQVDLINSADVNKETNPLSRYVTADLYLPPSASNGITNVWSSDAPSVISELGVVTRPAKGSPAETVQITLVSKIHDYNEDKDITQTKTFTFIVQPLT
jgi:hypothetical protein